MNRIPQLINAVALIGLLTIVPSVNASHQASISFTQENDLFSGSDGHYTNGLRFAWVSGRDNPPPDWAVKVASFVPWFPKQQPIRHGYAVGQSMFTPRHTRDTNPDPEDRPYAGWLYGSIGLGVEQNEQLDILALTLGVIGPSSFAGETQIAVHEWIGSPKPMGWDTQLKDEPGINLMFQRSWRGLGRTQFNHHQLDYTPHLGFTLGNIYTYANGGITLRYGENLPFDYGPPRVQHGLPTGTDFAQHKNFNHYWFAGIETRVVAQNIFLDGNNFVDSRQVNKNPVVADLQFGVIVDWENSRLSYTHVFRTPEFDTQGRIDSFGALTYSWRY